MANVMTTKELSRYLNSTRLRSVNMPLSGKFLPFGLGAYGGRFDKDVIDEWITTGQNETKADGKSKRKGGEERSGEKYRESEKDRLIGIMLRQRYGKRLCPDWGLIIMTTR